MTIYIDAAKKTFVAIFSIGLAIIYFSYLESRRLDDYLKKMIISSIASAVESAKNSESRIFETRDFSDFSQSALANHLSLQRRYADAVLEDGEPSQIDAAAKALWGEFGDEKNDLGRVVDDVSVPYATSKLCNLLVLKPDEYFFFFPISSLYFGTIFQAYSQNTRTIWLAESCLHRRWPQIRMALIVSGDQKREIVALPRDLAAFFPVLDIIEHNSFMNLDPTLQERLVPKFARKYLELSEPMVLLDLRSLRAMLIGEMERLTGQTYSTDDFESALAESYREERSKTNIIGFDVSVTDFLRWGPVVMFALSYYYWRLLRKIVSEKLAHKNAWAPFDAYDLIGVTVAYIWAFTPAMITIVVYILYPAAFGAVLNVAGYEISPIGILTLEIPKAMPSGWYAFDAVALLTLAFSFFHFFLIYVQTKAACRIVNASKSYSIRQNARLALTRLRGDQSQ